jgi:hypothetical protein
MATPEYVAPKRADFATSDEWLDALLGARVYTKPCPYACGKNIGPYSSVGGLQQGIREHVQWAHRLSDTLTTERVADKTMNDTRAKGYRRV